MKLDFGPQITAQHTTVREVFSFSRCRFESFQRGYVWQRSQVLDLLTDLTDCFLTNHKSASGEKHYTAIPIYYLGDLITKKKGAYTHVVDGQQRLLTLTLMILLIRNLHFEQNLKPYFDLDKLIYQDRFGIASFMIADDEYKPLLDALFNHRDFDIRGHSHSIANMYARYEDLRENWPAGLSNKTLQKFVSWFLRRVYFIEIYASSFDATYAIFETKNNRGLQMKPSDLLKGYLLENISDREKRATAANAWEEQLSNLAKIESGLEVECIKTWLQSKFARYESDTNEITTSQDFERIDDNFHRWLIDNSERIGLQSSNDYFKFINRDFRFFAHQYSRLVQASKEKDSELESVRHLSQLGSNIHFKILLSPLKPSDSNDIITKKLQITSYYVDTLISQRLWNGQKIGGKELQNVGLEIMAKIRNMNVTRLNRYFEKHLKNVEQFGENA